MISRSKSCILLASAFVLLLMGFLLKLDSNLSKFSSYSTIVVLPMVYENHTCNMSKNFSYINIEKYQKCLKWSRNDGFWSVDGLRHTAYKNILNSSSLIIEVGGNTGYDTSKFIELYNPSIISFEPLIQMSKNLIEKFKTNPKIEIQPFGLGNNKRNLSVELSGTENDGTSIFRKLSAVKSSNIQQIQLLDIIQVIENIRTTRTKNGIIDMISINCEGCEFEILPTLIFHNMTQYFRIIQFGTHIGMVPDSLCIYCHIEQALERTHQVKYHYSMLWEGWILKKPTEN